MLIADNPDWGHTAIIVAVCIAINLTLPIWLRMGKIWDASKNCGNEALQESDVDDSEDGDDDNDGDKKHDLMQICDDSSVVSDAQYSTVSSTISSQLAAILEARPRQTTGHGSNRKRRRRERDIRFRQLNFGENIEKAETTLPGGNFSGANSVMSKLSVDDVSMNDGVNEKGAEDIYNRKDISYERRSCWVTLLEVSEWDSSLTSLAGFYMVQGLTEKITSLVELAVISHLIGTTEANAFIMTDFLFEMTSIFTVGFQEAIGVLAPHADGSGNDLLVGRYLQIGIVFGILFQIPGFILWSVYMYDTIIWFGFDEQTAIIAQNYAYSILLYLMAETINECILAFFDVIDHEKYVTIFSMIRACVSSGVLVAMASFGVSNMVAIGLARTLVEITLLFANIIFVVNQGWFDDFSVGLVKTFGLKDRRAMRTTFVTAIPLAIAWILSIGEWQIMLIFAQSIGPDEVAAWNILGYIWDLFEALTEAIAGAAEVRVGFRMGAGKPQQAKKMSEKSIYLAVLLVVFAAGGLFVLAEFLPSWLTPDVTYQKLIFLQIPLIGFGGILMVPGLVIEGILIAQGRVRLMTAIEVIVSWFIAIPLAAISVYYFNTSLEGIVSGLVVGYSTGATVLSFFFLRSNWEQLSKMVTKRNAAEGLQYLDTDWDDLPSRVQEAASTLGYTKILWESNMEPESNEKNWNDLTEAEQTAAGILGYNKNKWDGNAEDGEQYDKYDFDDLPTEVKKAAKFLGFTRSIWDKDGSIQIESKDWSQLTEAEQKAATILGYTQEKWDNESDSSSSSSNDSAARRCTKMLAIPEEKEVNYDDCDFLKLPTEVKKAATFLGYTRSIWDKDGSIPNESKDWTELTKAEQKAASILGYTQEKWDNESDSSSSSSNDSEPRQRSEMSVISNEKEVNYDDCDFLELPTEVKKAAKVLGYTRSIWDKDGSIPNESKDWTELTKAEQKAASILGYTKDKWKNKLDSKSLPSDGILLNGYLDSVTASMFKSWDEPPNHDSNFSPSDKSAPRM